MSVVALSSGSQSTFVYFGASVGFFNGYCINFIDYIDILKIYGS